VGQANVNGSKLRALSLPLPPQRAQDSIVRAVSRQLAAADSLCAVFERAASEAATLERAILHRALTGQLVEPVASSETAADLLVSIAERERPSRRRRSRS